MTIDATPAQPAARRPPPAARRPRTQRWLIVATATWAVVLAAMAVYAVRRGEPTVRAQTSIAQALPTVDRVIADVATAGFAAGAVVEISGYREVDTPCSITAVRSGARVERSADLYVPAGQEAVLVDQVGARLPRRYEAEVRPSGSHPLTADAGNYVVVRGGVAGPGAARITADTGCRPLTGRVAEAPPDTEGRAPVEAVFGTLGVPGTRWQTHRVDCAHGGSVRTVQADGPAGSAPASLAGALHQASAVLARPELYVYRTGPVGVVARTHDGVVTVTATTGCGSQ